MSISKMQ